jgi:Na+/proline symporter
MGRHSYKTGASFFLLSKTLGAAARLYLVVVILQTYVFEQWKIPFVVTTAFSVLLIWLYTFRSGIRTIVWTDTLQTFCFIGMLVIILWQVKNYMNLDFAEMVKTVTDSQHLRIFEFENWSSKQHFVKQFFSGAFISIVMTGLDQDMMQKNLTCRSLKDAQKNMYVYSLAFTPINFLFLTLGVLLVTLATQLNMTLPESGDDILPLFCTSGIMGMPILVFFTIGIIAAAFSSADSALASLTTSFCVDILDIKKEDAEKAKKIRLKVHVSVSIFFIVIILLFRAVNNRSIIDAIYTIASYTYGPLLGLFVFGLFTKHQVRDHLVPYICLTSPLVCLAADWLITHFTSYRFGYEMLMINGFLTFLGLLLSKKK